MISSQYVPFYFGTPDKQLFGCYHAPQVGRSRDCGIVICYPLEPEYIRAHRACHQLAIRLTREGFPVLRFDFYGSGDSGGEAEEGHVGQWLNDINQATAELKERSGVTKICLVGLRFGASLAVMAGTERDDLVSLVLWEPIIKGKLYLDELAAQQQKMLWYISIHTENGSKNKRPTELLGLPITDTLISNFESLDLLTIQKKPANNILIVEGQMEADVLPLKEYLQRFESQVTYQHISDYVSWMENPDKGLVPNQILQAIISWISEAHQ